MNVQQAVENLREAIRAEVREEILARLGGATPKTGLHGTVVRAVRRVEAATKRTPEEINLTCADIVAQLGKTPGIGVGTIGAALSKTRDELDLPIAKLLAAKVIRKTGQKRTTRYFAK